MGKTVGSVLKPVTNIVSKVPIIGKPISNLVGGAADDVFGTADENKLLGTPRDEQSQILADLRIANTGDMMALANRPISLPSVAMIDKLAAARAGLSGAEEKNILAGADDARRRLQSMIKSRGLEGSSIGLSEDRNITQDTAERIANANARRAVSLAEAPFFAIEAHENSLDKQLQNRMNALNSLPFTSPQPFTQTTPGTPGLLPAVGAMIGGLLGGVKGAGVGAAAGGASSQTFGNAGSSIRRF